MPVTLEDINVTTLFGVGFVYLFICYIVFSTLVRELTTKLSELIKLYSEPLRAAPRSLIILIGFKNILRNVRWPKSQTDSQRCTRTSTFMVVWRHASSKFPSNNNKRKLHWVAAPRLQHSDSTRCGFKQLPIKANRTAASDQKLSVYRKKAFHTANTTRLENDEEPVPCAAAGPVSVGTCCKSSGRHRWLHWWCKWKLLDLSAKSVG